MSDIKAIITDVDGVMVGKDEGVNFPLPHKEVLSVLEHVSASGIPIVLCTAKFGSAIKEIAVQAKLNNPHITDGGAVVIDWVDGAIVSQHNIAKGVVLEYITSSIKKGIYVEIYTADKYYIQDSQSSSFTKHRTKVLQVEPEVVVSLSETAKKLNVIKIISFSKDEDITELQANVEQLGDKVNYIWSQHPFLFPHRILILTAPGVSKQQAAKEVARSLNVPFSSILGIGDSEADWSFMQLCGYAATIGESGGNLQELSKTKGQGNFYFAKSVDDHGFIEVMQHFGLEK